MGCSNWQARLGAHACLKSSGDTPEEYLSAKRIPFAWLWMPVGDSNAMSIRARGRGSRRLHRPSRHQADPRGWIEKQGGTVIGTVALTGKPHSAKLNPTKEQLRELRDKHGREFEKWWRTKFGHAFNCLTQSEARYLARSPDVDTIRDRLAAAERQGDRAGSPGSHREQDRRPKELKSYRPPTPRRPVPTRWQGYGRPPKPAPDPTPQTVFDPHIIVLTIKARRVSLPATLKLTMAVGKCTLTP